MQRQRQRSMHGDLVNGLCYSIFVPAYGYLGWTQPCVGGVMVNFWFLTCTICCWVSYLTGSSMASLLACLSMAASIACMNLYQWPIEGEVIVFPQFLWMLLITTGNISLSFRYKLSMGVIALATAVLVAILSPLVEWSENLPSLLGAFAVFAMFHYYQDKQHCSEGFLSARTAKLVLAGALAYHFSSEVTKMRTLPGYTSEGGYSILQAGFFASVGLAAAGFFQKQVDLTDALEAIVAVRTKEVIKQAKELHMVGLAVQASETAIAIVDSHQQIEWCNAALEKLLPQQNVIGHSLLSALAPSDETVQAVKQSFDENVPRMSEVTVKDVTYSVEVSPIPPCAVLPDDSKPETDPLLSSCSSTRYLVVLKDTTAQRARERAEKHAQKEAMLKQAMRQSMETLSHELRTPLQGVMGMTSLLLDSEDLTVEEAKEAMSMVMVSSRLLLTLINNLLDVRKCDAKLMNEFQLSSVPLTSSMRDSVNFCRPLGTVSNVTLDLSVDATGEKALVLMNPIRFQQVVINLVSNAIKYTKPGSTVRLHGTVMPMKEVRSLMDTALSCGLAVNDAAPILDDALVAVVSIKDSGAGIDETKINQVFQKFSQGLARQGAPNVLGRNQVAQPTGTGLGLNLCLKFVKRMNGNIWVSENPEGGACFSFYLPCGSSPVIGSNSLSDIDPADSPTISIHAATESHELDPNGAIGDYSVLLVDDTAINLKVLDRMLCRVGVQNVKCVDSGAKALELLEKEEFDLVLTDIQMPEMSGTELSEIVHRRNDLSCKPLVVGLTAETGEGVLRKCLSSGMGHVLHKPITTTEFQIFFSDILEGRIQKGTVQVES